MIFPIFFFDFIWETIFFSFSKISVFSLFVQKILTKVIIFPKFTTLDLRTRYDRKISSVCSLKPDLHPQTFSVKLIIRAVIKIFFFCVSVGKFGKYLPWTTLYDKNAKEQSCRE